MSGHPLLNCGPLVHPVLPMAASVPFSTYNNRFAGQVCYVVGRGKTDFDYNDLAAVESPIFFINDAVCLAHLAKSEAFFFAHDPHLAPWLNGGTRATAVLPIDGKVLDLAPDTRLRHNARVVYYHWPGEDRADLLMMTRNQLAAACSLYTHSGSIHSLLHFVWYCGFAHVNFIGCDGFSQCHSPDESVPDRGQYDPRLQNRSNSQPAREYSTIRSAQDLLTALFRLDVTYLGTPDVK